MPQFIRSTRADIIGPLNSINEIQEWWRSSSLHLPDSADAQEQRQLRRTYPSIQIELYFQRKQTLISIQTSFPAAHKIFNIIFNECWLMLLYDFINSMLWLI